MPKSPKRGKRVYRFELWQDGMCVASVESYKKDFARKEMEHYALMYGQDGKVIVKDVTALSGYKRIKS